MQAAGNTKRVAHLRTALTDSRELLDIILVRMRYLARLHSVQRSRVNGHSTTSAPILDTHTHMHACILHVMCVFASSEVQ